MANNKEWVSEEKWKIYLRKMYKQSWERRKMKTNLFPYKEYFILHIALSSASHTKVLPTLYYYDSISSLMLSWNVLHRVLFRQKCHYVYHFFSSSSPSFLIYVCAYDDVHLYVGEWRGWNVRRTRRIRREKETAKKKSFRRRHLFSAWRRLWIPSVILFYMLKLWAALYSL